MHAMNTQNKDSGKKEANNLLCEEQVINMAGHSTRLNRFRLFGGAVSLPKLLVENCLNRGFTPTSCG